VLIVQLLAINKGSRLNGLITTSLPEAAKAACLGSKRFAASELV
jgi:hypothetical protein